MMMGTVRDESAVPAALASGSQCNCVIPKRRHAACSTAATRRARRVVIDVGGQLFVTTRATVEKMPADSVLARLLAEEAAAAAAAPSKPSDEAYVFVDRDPTHFGTLLNFFRAGYSEEDCLGGMSEKELRNAVTEASYYGFLRLQTHGLNVLADRALGGHRNGKE